jgi:hypothetical protein
MRRVAGAHVPLARPNPGRSLVRWAAQAPGRIPVPRAAVFPCAPRRRVPRGRSATGRTQPGGSPVHRSAAARGRGGAPSLVYCRCPRACQRARAPAPCSGRQALRRARPLPGARELAKATGPHEAPSQWRQDRARSQALPALASLLLPAPHPSQGRPEGPVRVETAAGYQRWWGCPQGCAATAQSALGQAAEGQGRAGACGCLGRRSRAPQGRASLMRLGGAGCRVRRWLHTHPRRLCRRGGSGQKRAGAEGRARRLPFSGQGLIQNATLQAAGASRVGPSRRQSSRHA